MTRRYCPECGFQNQEEGSYCSKCGASLPEKEGGIDTTIRYSPEAVEREIAEMLGLTEETVSRVMADFARKKIIGSGKGYIRILDRKDFLSKYYLRFTTKDKPGVLSKISGILGEEGVSISSVYQPMVADRESQRPKSVKGRPRTDPHAAHILLTTHSAPEGHIQKAVQEIDRLPTACAKTVCIRIEEP